MTPRLGQAVLGLSAAGFPLTQLAIRRFGRRGAIVAEGVCLGLLVRDGAMIAAGAPRRLRRGPALLLWLEFGAALVAVLAGLPPALDEAAATRAGGSRAVGLEGVRRAAVGTLFGLHTARFRTYLQPDRGLKQAVDGPA